MQKFFCLVILILVAYAQNSLQVYHFNFDSTSFNFEKLFIEEIISLYNKKHKNSKFKLKYETTKSFEELFTILLSADSNSLALSGITITKDRKQHYDFSTIYLPVRNAIVTSNDSKLNTNNWYNSGYKLGYFKNTVQKRLAINLKEIHDIQIIELDKLNYTNMNDIFDSKIVDMLFFEGLDLANTKKLKQLKILIDKSIGYGVMYPKGSSLNSKLEPFITYFIHSKPYFKLLKNVYGVEVSEQIFKKLN